MTIEISGSITGKGTLEITNNTTLILDGAVGSGQTVLFDVSQGAVGRLVLGDPSEFQGQISGFQKQDQIDLPTITFHLGTTKAAYADNGGVPNDNSGGTLTIYETDADGNLIAVLATITFKGGNYTTANFNLASDGSGGTLIKDPPAETLTTTTDASITTTDASITTIDASTATTDAWTATTDITVSPGARTSTLTPTEGANSTRMRATAAAIDDSIMVALSTAVAVALTTAASASDGSELPASNSGDNTAVDITAAVPGSESSSADSSAAAKFSPASHSMAGNGAVENLGDKAEIADPVDQTGMVKIEATPQSDGSDAVSALDPTDGASTDSVNLVSDYTTNAAHNLSNEGRGSKTGHDSPASATGEHASLQSSAADSDLILTSPATLSGNGAHSASPLNPSLDHRAISADLDTKSTANNQLLQQTANNKAAYLDDNSLLRSDGAQPANVHFDVSQLTNFRFADDNGNHFGSIAHDPPALGLAVLSNDGSGNHGPDAPAHAAAKDASVLPTPADSHFIADSPFTEPLGGNGRHSASEQGFEHRAIADPEINSITKNQLLEFAGNSLHMPAQLDDGGVLMTDRAHAAHSHVDENPLADVKLANDGSNDPGRIGHDPPALGLAVRPNDGSGTHGPDAPIQAGGKDASVHSTPADSHIVLSSPLPETPSVNGDHFRFPSNLDKHAIGEPEINSVAKNQSLQEPAGNSLHIPAQLDDGGVPATDGAHPAHPHSNENQLANFKFVDDGGTNPGATIYDAPTLAPTGPSSELSGPHGPPSVVLAGAPDVPGTATAHAASQQIGGDQFMFGKSFVRETIADFKLDMTEVDHPTIVEIQHLLDVAHDTGAASPLDPHFGTAPQDMAKAQLPPHLDQFHFV